MITMEYKYTTIVYITMEYIYNITMEYINMEYKYNITMVYTTIEYISMESI